MTSMLLSSCANFPVIKQVAYLLGKILQAFYFLFDSIGFESIGLCIITFTIIVKLVMIPMTIKQQRFQKLSSIINPEIQAIQKKYQNRKDQTSMMAMQDETKAVYAKYGTSPTGGCLQLLIQMPILFALYAVIYNVPGYVDQVRSYYDTASEKIVAYTDDLENVNELYKYVDNYYENKDKEDYKYVYSNVSTTVSDILKDGSDYLTVSEITTLLSNTTDSSLSDKWENIVEAFEQGEEITKKLDILTDTNKLELVDKIAQKDYDEEIASKTDEEKVLFTDEQKEQLLALKKTNAQKLLDKYYKAESDVVLNDEFQNTVETINKQKDIIDDINEFAGMNLSNSPSKELSLGHWWALLIPILSAVFQWLSTKLVQAMQTNPNQPNPMGSSMKMMNIFMPLMSLFFTFSFPSALGLYWVVTAVFQCVQQVVVNKHFSKIDAQEIVNQNMEKVNKKRAKKGLPPKKITAAASTNAKSINSPVQTKVVKSDTDVKASTDYYNSKQTGTGSIASRANMVKAFNDKNNK